MTRDVVNISTNTNQEEVARAIQRYDFLALPVVDKEKRLVGIVTVDDLIDVIEQEATRDIYAAGAVQPGDEDDYFQSSLFTIARRRILWLLILVLANGLTTKVIAITFVVKPFAKTKINNHKILLLAMVNKLLWK